jgi:phage baseplate assembly protein V
MIEAVFRRIQMMFGRGRVTYTDDSGPVQKMQVRLSGLETSDGRVRMAEFGFTSNPPIGSDVLTLHVSGDRGAGTVFATNHQQSRPTGLLAGESKLYSQDGKYVYMTAASGITVEAKGQDVVVNDARNVVWNCSGNFTLNVGGIFKVVAPGGSEIDTPELKTSGDILDNFGTNTDTVAGMRTVANGHTHPILLVQTGSSNINTQPPTQHE